MQVSIAGSGVTGAYLSFLLSKKHSVDVYEKKALENIGQDCAWATGLSELSRISGKIGLDPKEYLLHEADKVISDVFSNKDAVTFDKNAFLRDVIKSSEADFHFETPLEGVKDSDLVVDATGSTRSVLAGSDNCIIAPCYQIEIESDDENMPEDMLIDLRSGIGYLWCFPHDHNVYRVGCGLINGNPKDAVDEFLSDKEYNVASNRCGAVRLSSPLRDSLHAERQGVPVVGVGEAVGTVCPISGEGIVPSIRSSELLCESISDGELRLEEYERSMRREFGWVESQLRFIESLTEKSSVHQLYSLIRVDVPDYLSGSMSKLSMIMKGW